MSLVTRLHEICAKPIHCADAIFYFGSGWQIGRSKYGTVAVIQKEVLIKLIKDY